MQNHGKMRQRPGRWKRRPPTIGVGLHTLQDEAAVFIRCGQQALERGAQSFDPVFCERFSAEPVGPAVLDGPSQLVASLPGDAPFWGEYNCFALSAPLIG